MVRLCGHARSRSGFGPALLILALLIVLVQANPQGSSPLDDPGPPTSSGASPSAPTGSRATSPSFQINMDSSTKHADVAPGETGAVEFTGQVLVEPSDLASTALNYKVELETECDLDWARSVTPSSIVFPSEGGSEPITVKVRAPPAISYVTVATVTVAGTCTPLQGTGETTTTETKVVVLVNQYYRFSVECAKPDHVWKGDTITYLIRINNEGNGPDSYGTTIGNEDYLQDRGINVDVRASSLTIGEKDFDEVAIDVRCSDTTEFGEYHIRLIIKSTGAQGTEDEQYDYYLYLDVDERADGSLMRHIRTNPETYWAAVVLVAVVLAGVVMLVRRRRRRKRLEQEEEEGKDMVVGLKR